MERRPVAALTPAEVTTRRLRTHYGLHNTTRPPTAIAVDSALSIVMRCRTLLYCDRNGVNEAHKCLWLEQHVDNSNRIRLCRDRLEKCGLLDRCELLSGRSATVEEVALCHPPDYLRTLAATSSMGQWELETLSAKFERIFLSSGSYKAAMWAAGSAVNAMETLIHSQDAKSCYDSALVLARPAGQEAFSDQAHANCLLNNVAICAKVAVKRHRLSRVLIIDWSASPGNGTRILLQNDQRIVIVSIFKYISGAAAPWLSSEQWASALGNIVSIPLNTDIVGDAEYLGIFQHIVCPITREFDPELVLISAGFDAAIGDPAGQLNLSPGVYAHLIRLVQIAAPQTPLCAVLEGGYHAESLAQCTKWTLKALLGDPPPKLGCIGHISPSVIRSIWQVCAQSQNRWKTLGVQLELLECAKNILELKPMTLHFDDDSFHGGEFRRRMDVLVERGLYPTRSESGWQEGVSRGYDAQLEEMVKGYELRKPRYSVSFLYPAKSSCALLARQKYSAADATVLFLQQNRPVSDKELDFVNEQTKVTANHEHDFGGSNLTIGQQNETCRLMAPLVSALDSMKTDQAKASVCVVDLKTEVINRVFKSALPLLRKMRKIAADDRVLIVDVSESDTNQEILDVRDAGILHIYLSAFIDCELKSLAALSLTVAHFAVPIAYEYDPHLVLFLGDAARCSAISSSFSQFANGRSLTVLSTDSNDDGVLACLTSAIRAEHQSFEGTVDKEMIDKLAKAWTDLRSKWCSLADRLFDSDTEANADIAEAAAIAVHKERSAQFLDYAEGKRPALPCIDTETVFKDKSRASLFHKLLFCVPSNNALVLK